MVDLNRNMLIIIGNGLNIRFRHLAKESERMVNTNRCSILLFIRKIPIKYTMK